MSYPSTFLKAISLALSLSLQLLVTALLAQEPPEQPNPPRKSGQNIASISGPGEVLVLYSLGSQVPAYSEWSRGIRQGLRDAQGNTPILNVEFLDLARYDDSEHTRLWLELMRIKYSQRDIRVVVPVLGPALRFATTHLREMFPDAAVVFASVDQREANRLTDTSGVTGVVYRADVAKTCQLALQLRPHTSRIVCISGSSALGKSLDQLARHELASLEEQVDVVYWHGLRLDELTRRVRDLPEDHVVVYLVYFADDQGRDYVPAEAAAALCDASPVPVFGLYNTLLSHGVLGGHMVDFDAQATETGRLVRRVLGGENPGDLPTRGHEMNQPLVHWQRLQHWNISETNVPSQAIVLHRTPTFWERYRWLAVTILGLLVLQFALIAAMLFLRVQRQRAEQALILSKDALIRQRDELARVNRIATVEEMATSIAHEVNQPLSAIVSNANAAVRLLMLEEPDTSEAIVALKEISADGNRAAGLLERVRSLTQKRTQALAPLDFNQVVLEVLRLARSNFVEQGIVVREHLQNGLPLVTGDRIELQQVILNLLSNGARAIGDVPPAARTLIIQTTLQDGSVHLTVQDRGVGLDDDQLNRIFDAFFTTKSDGLGMGLSISRSIMEAHEGRIWATQNRDGGCTFHVALPVAEQRSDRG